MPKTFVFLAMTRTFFSDRERSIPRGTYWNFRP
jgi:hypothetical protein